MATRIKEKYLAEAVPALQQKFGYKNVMEIPKLDKIVINMGLGDCKDNAKAFEIVEYIRFNALQAWLCRFHSVRVNAERQILCLDKSVVALGELVTEHLRVLGSDGIILVAAQRNGDLRAVGVLVCRHVEE